jgi:chaperonin cofactor prefoldin
MYNVKLKGIDIYKKLQVENKLNDVFQRINKLHSDTKVYINIVSITCKKHSNKGNKNLKTLVVLLQNRHPLGSQSSFFF